MRRLRARGSFGAMFIPEPLKYILGSLMLLIMALGFAARRFPTVAWLRHFDFERHLTPEQRERNRRRANRLAAAQLVIFGFVIVMGFILLTILRG